MNNKEFLKSIYEVVNMGDYSCNKLLEDLEGKNNKIISVIEEMKKKYCSFQKDTKKLDNDLWIVNTYSHMFKNKLDDIVGTINRLNNKLNNK